MQEPKEECHQVSRQVPEQVPKQECHKVPRQVCKQGVQEGAHSEVLQRAHKGSNVDSSPRNSEVPKRNAKQEASICQGVPSVSRANCEAVPTQKFQSVPKQRCQTVSDKKCQIVPCQSCQAVPSQSCQTVPQQQCRTVPREVLPRGDRQPECHHLSSPCHPPAPN